MSKMTNVVLLLVAMVFVSSGCGGSSSSGIASTPKSTTESDGLYSNITYPSGITQEMSVADFWTTRVTNSNQVLLTEEEIQEINSDILSLGDEVGVYDVENIQEIKKSVFVPFEKPLYINGQPVNETALIAQFEAGRQVLSTYLYGITVGRADVKSWPMNGPLAYDKPDDPDDEVQDGALEINSPWVISEKCTVNGEVFYYGKGQNQTGWISANSLAICSSKSEWLNAWKFDASNKDFIVVTEDRIHLAPMLLEPLISEVELGLGAKLKLVPVYELPEKIGERQATWFNYVVYIPCRDANGNYVRKMAMIPKRCSVNLGYLPMTQENLTKVAFSVLGNRFSWGGSMKSYDSSLFHVAVYSCFGITLPRNTSTQRSIPDYYVNLEGVNSADKQAIIESLPVGSLLYFPGFSMQYLGNINGTYYVISSCGVLSDTAENEEVDVRRVYTISVTPLSIRRRNGLSWYDSIDGILNFFN